MTTIQFRRDTAANWTSVNPTLAQGEPALETDTGRRKLGDGTTAWATLPYLTDETQVSADIAATSVPLAGVNYRPAKRVTAAIGSPNASQAAAALDQLQRVLVKLPVTTTRWRLRVANTNLLDSIALTTPLTITSVYAGIPDYTSAATVARWTGKFTAAPTQVLPGFAVPVDGSDYVSGWVTDPSQQFVAGADRLLSWGITAPNTGTGWAITSGGRACAVVTAAGSAHVAELAPVGLALTGISLIGDVRVEFEWAGMEQVGLYLGDSITCGVGDGDVYGASTSTHAHEAWPSVAAALGGSVAINAGIGSAGISAYSGHQSFSALTNHAFTRFDLATTVPDFAVIALGANDLAGVIAGITPAYLTLINNLRSIGIPRIYVATVTPRYGTASQGYLTASTVAGATTITSSINTGTVPILLGSGRHQETPTVTAVTGTGPWTLTVPALTWVHTGGSGLGAGGAEQICVGNEIVRQQLNDWIRQCPQGVLAALDFAAEIATFPSSATPNPAYMSSDNLHPLRAGYGRLGAAAAGLGASRH